ncbi:MAG TPA: cytochrome b/b6 domain-containing protein, partial [Rhodocyclaceae bacterium]|nr:cytochrome b/b6 domain-containing protein [Rhodocyclaceae bacterium]
GPLPLITPRPPQWQERVARWTHRGLYLFLLLMPVLGWLIFSAKGAAVPLPLSGFELPPLPLPALLTGKEVAHSFKEVHETVANVGYALIGLHAVAALFHHYVLHDDTLTRMLPQRR